MTIRTNVLLEVRDLETGETRELRSKNLVTDEGLNVARDLFAGNGYRPDAIALGSGTSPSTAGMTALESEVWRRTIDRRTPGTASVTFQAFLATSEANGFTLSEMGLFEAGRLVARALLSPALPKTGSIEATISHEITFADGST